MTEPNRSKELLLLSEWSEPPLDLPPTGAQPTFSLTGAGRWLWQGATKSWLFCASCLKKAHVGTPKGRPHAGPTKYNALIKSTKLEWSDTMTPNTIWAIARLGRHREFARELDASANCHGLQKAGYVRSSVISIGHAGQFVISRGMPSSLISEIDKGATQVLMMDDVGQLQQPTFASPKQTCASLIKQYKNLDGWCDVNPHFNADGLCPTLSGLRRAHDQATHDAALAAGRLLCKVYDVNDITAALSLVPDSYRSDLARIVSK